MSRQKMAKRQHTVPMVYLRGFAVDGLITVRRRSGGERDLPLKTVGVRNDFYNFRNSAGVRIGSIENWFANRIEGPVGQLFERLRAGDVPTESDVPSLAAFAVTQLLRTPALTDLMDQIDEHLRPFLVVHHILKEHGISPLRLSTAEMNRLMNVARSECARQVSPDENRKSQMRTVLRKADELGRQLENWSWSVLTADHPVLITGDAPAVTIRSDGGGWRGILPPGSPIYLPLSPSKLLIGEPHSIAGGATTLTAELACAVNQAIARDAYEVVLRMPKAAWPAGADLSRTRPRLNAPRITWSKTAGAPPTFPFTYPAVESDDIRSLLADLEAQEVVE